MVAGALLPQLYQSLKPRCFCTTTSPYTIYVLVQNHNWLSIDYLASSDTWYDHDHESLHFIKRPCKEHKNNNE
jgi:hypothetical protein